MKISSARSRSDPRPPTRLYFTRQDEDLKPDKTKSCSCSRLRQSLDFVSAPPSVKQTENELINGERGGIWFLPLVDILIWEKVTKSNLKLTAQCEDTQLRCSAFSPDVASVAS